MQKKLILFNKPFQVLSQFEDAENRNTLKKYIPIKEVYPAGRLDYDSEGLMILTNCGKTQHEISNPKNKTIKTYWVQIENIPTEMDLKKIRQGIKIKDHLCLPASVKIIDEPLLWQRVPPIRERQSIPTCWLELSIQEGKNRQVRRMTAAMGFPTLRLIRVKMGPWQLNQLKPGEYSQVILP
ncbi:MAG: pseudouridine synthase [Gammaproteobacteria bacterium]|nr:pseudouridine synthase [Gammaproteobacteria bacterium]MCH9764016.1 pseudouridine synthase [Gammaproteobacteria bacterium]